MGAYDQNQFIPVGSGLFVGQGLPVDYRTVVTDSTQRFNLDWYTAFNGLIVYQQDTQELFVLIDKGPSIPGSTISQPSSWRLVGSGGTGSAFAGEWAFTNTLNQSFAFEGSGLPSPENDPTLYLLRGQSYRFSNNNTIDTLPFQIQSDLSTIVDGGTAYNLGVTNNRASGSQQLIFDVPNSAPDQLFYQCPLFPEMSGSLIIVGNPGVGSGFPFTGSAEITGSLGVTGSISVSGSVINQLTASQAQSVPFDGNRPISNLDLAVNGVPLDLYGQNMNTSELTEFVDQVFFRNSPPVIVTDRLSIQEFEPASTVVGQIVATDPENLPGMVFSSVGVNPNFDIDNTGEITMKIQATASLNTTQDPGNLDPSGTPRESAVFKIQVTDQGNLTTEKDIFIRIIPNIAPIISSSPSGYLPISPNITQSLLESSTITLPPNPKFTFYSRDMNSDNLNSLSGDTVLVETGSLTPPFSDYFGLVIENNNTQNVTIKVNQTQTPLDFETFPSYSFVLTASDNHFGSGISQDSESISYLPVQIKLTDNNSPIIGDWNFGSINEKSSTNASAGNITTISDTENDVIQFVKWNIKRVFHTDNPSVNLTSSLGGTSLLDPSIDPFNQPNDGPANGTFTITRGSNKFLNSDIANRYVYDCGITDFLAPDVNSASIEISIQDHGATLPTVNTAGNIIESSRANDTIVGGGFAVTNPNGYTLPNTKIQTSTISQDWDISVKSPGSLPTDLFEASPLSTGNYINLKLKSDLSGSGVVGGDSIVLAITASQTDFTTTKQKFDKTISVKSMSPPTFSFTNIPSNLNTNGARPGDNLVKPLKISDPQGYPIDHSTFTFTGVNLSATRIGTTDNYFVQSTTNLSAGDYTFNVSVENDRGFTAGTDSHTITIVDANNGTLIAPTANIIESATNGDDVVINFNGFGVPNEQTQLAFSFNPPYNNPSVASITNTTAGSPIDIVGSGVDIGKLSVNANYSGYVSGDIISVNIEFEDNYGNVGTGTFNVSVKPNNPPTATFTNQSQNFTTDNATSGVDMINITNITDPQNSTSYTLSISGTDFTLSSTSVGNNGSAQVQVGSSALSAGTYSFTVTITNPFGKSTDFPRSITIGQSPNFGRVYIYSTNMAGYANDYNTEMGIQSVSGTDPVEITAIIGPGTNNTTIAAFDNGNIGSNSVNLAGSFTLTKLTDFIGDSSTPSLKTLLENNGAITVPSFQPPASFGHRIIVLVPYNSSMTDVPIKMTDQPGSNANFGNMYLSSAGAFNITNSTLNLLTLSSPQQGYSQWLVIGTISPGSSGDKEIRIQPETIQSTPT